MKRADAVIQSFVVTMLGFLVGGFSFTVLLASWIWIDGAKSNLAGGLPWELHELISGGLVFLFCWLLINAALFLVSWVVMILPVTLLIYHTRLHERHTALIGVFVGAGTGVLLLHLSDTFSRSLGFQFILLACAALTGGLSGHLLRLKPKCPGRGSGFPRATQI